MGEECRSRDLAVSVDGTFVETTSEAAARSIAKFYSTSTSNSNERVEYAVQHRIDDRGRTVFRIRPLSTSNDSPPTSSSPSSSARSLAFARPSNQPTIKNLHDDDHLSPHMPLRKAGSTPIFRATTSEEAMTLKRAQSSSTTNRRRDGSSARGGDVLGRILGWNETTRDDDDASEQQQEQQEQRTMRVATATTTDRASARVPLSELFQNRSDSPDRDFDSSDLPRDSVVDALADPIATRLDRQVTTTTTTTGKLETPDQQEQRAMREVASNDSIRTARADDPPRVVARAPRGGASRPSPPPRARFRDPRIFDVFHFASSPSSTTTSVSRSGRHARVSSSASVDSTTSSSPSSPGRPLSSSSSGRPDATTGKEVAVHSSLLRDDPRFAVWAHKEPALTTTTTTTNRQRRRSIVASPPLAIGKRRGSVANEQHESYPNSPATSASGSPATTSSRRWSLSARGGGGTGSGYASPATSFRESVGSNAGHGEQRRVLVAATVERLVAELTSQISVELVSEFFLTYRHYLDAVDLVDLLVARFEWAIERPSSNEDDAVRRVVRVRTFVVVRYWLLNHFMDDFFPSRDVRVRLTTWLNDAARDPRWRQDAKDARLIKNLKKTVRKCKETFIVPNARPPPLLSTSSSNKKATATTGPGRDTISPPKGANSSEEEEEDVDLVDEDDRPAPGRRASTTTDQRAPSHAFKFGTFRTSRKNSTAVAATDVSLSSSLAPVSTSTTTTLSSEPVFPLPGTAQNPIARSFAAALGTFGRFKRMIGQRTASNAGLEHVGIGGVAHNSGGGDVDIEFEQSETGDLLWVKGGLERYLEYWNIKREEDDSRTAASTREPRQLVVPEVVVDQAPAQQEEHPSLPSPLPSAPPRNVDGADPTVSPEEEEEGHKFTGTIAAPLIPIFDPESYEPTLTFGTRPPSARIELDDLDDSDDDDEDDDDDVVEVKRTLKRLPNAHNLRLGVATARASARSAASSAGSETSYGFGHGDFDPRLSYAGPERESFLFVDEDDVLGGGGAATVIPNFILEGLLDSEDEDEPGDVEAALRRLEGLVDTGKEEEKAKKVERQMQRSERLELEKKNHPEQDAENDDLSATDPRLARRASTTEGASVDVVVATDDDVTSGVPVPFSSQTSPPITNDRDDPLESVPSQPEPEATAKATTRDAVNPMIAAGRKATLSRIFGGSAAPPAAPASPAPPPPPPTHRSFLLFCRTEILAQQFTLIERDMLRMLSYQELAGGSWRTTTTTTTTTSTTDVLDWEAYLKDRRRQDVVARELGQPVPPSAVRDVVARFNLMANWVASEILLTANVDERALLIEKFIRLAFKSYCQSNFQTVMQIVHGLEIPHVNRLRKTWSKVATWELRKLEGMRRFVSHLQNFKHLRDLTNRLAAEYSPDLGGGANSSTRSSSDPIAAGLALRGCIPFVGLFLRDLAFNAELATFIDPAPRPTTRDELPDHAASSDDNDDDVDVDHSVPSSPLVNLDKFRKLATIVQRIRTLQALSERYPFEPVPAVYFKCLKIRSLDQVVMQELSSRLEP